MANPCILVTPNGHNFGTTFETLLATANRLENRTQNGVGLPQTIGAQIASPNEPKTRRTQDATPGGI